MPHPERSILPTAKEVLRSFPLQNHSRPLAGFSLDVKSAHKRILLHPSERGLVGFSLNSDIYFHYVAPFGATFSAPWWSGLGGWMLRLFHHLIWWPHCGLLYVDEFLFYMAAQSMPLAATLFYMAAQSMPLAATLCCISANLPRSRSVGTNPNWALRLVGLGGTLIFEQAQSKSQNPNSKVEAIYSAAFAIQQMHQKTTEKNDWFAHVDYPAFSTFAYLDSLFIFRPVQHPSYSLQCRPGGLAPIVQPSF